MLFYFLYLVVGLLEALQHSFLDCSNYEGWDQCNGRQVDYPDMVDERMWQTPGPNDAAYHDSWQNYRDLQGYARILYASDRQSATIEIVTRQREDGELEYQYGTNAPWSADYQKKVKKGETNSEGLSITVRYKKNEKITLKLDPLYFLWDLEVVDAPHTKQGQRGAIVELFGWPYKDIEKECEFLSKAGYMGVKVFPGQEHVESFHYLQNGELNPWWFVYQPVSYRLQSRLGTRQELRQMISTCRRLGVRVYSDAVVNHMSGSGNDVQMHRQARGGCLYWGPKNATAGSPYFTHSWTFGLNPQTEKRPTLEYPAVPYTASDFHCERAMNDWASGFSLNYGWLVGLTDLNTEKPYVQQRIADFFTDLLSIGFSGFRIDAAKHIKPDDLAQIFSRLKKNLGSNDLPSDFITWLEVIMGGEKDLLACRNNEYNFYTYFDKAMTNSGLSATDISKVKIWSSDYPKEFPICGHWVLPASRFAVQNDDQ